MRTDQRCPGQRSLLSGRTRRRVGFAPSLWSLKTSVGLCRLEAPPSGRLNTKLGVDLVSCSPSHLSLGTEGNTHTVLTRRQGLSGW